MPEQQPPPVTTRDPLVVFLSVLMRSGGVNPSVIEGAILQTQKTINEARGAMLPLIFDEPTWGEYCGALARRIMEVQ